MKEPPIRECGTGAISWRERIRRWGRVGEVRLLKSCEERASMEMGLRPQLKVRM